VVKTRTSGKLVAAAAAAALLLTGADTGVALADTPPSGCGFHVKDPGNPVYSAAFFNNCSIYPATVHLDVVLSRDRDVCVKGKADTVLESTATPWGTSVTPGAPAPVVPRRRTCR
jgi:hypothetical protein